MRLEQAQAELYQRGGRSEEERRSAQNAVDARRNELDLAKELQDEARETARIENDALEAKLAGNMRLSEILTRQLNTEMAARKAELGGQPELAQQIRERGRLEQEGSDFGAAYDSRRGRLLSDRARVEAGQTMRRSAMLQATALARFRRQGGLVDPKYDLNGNLESGIDPNTGERRAPNADEQAMIDKQRRADQIDRYKHAGASERARMEGSLGTADEHAAARGIALAEINTATPSILINLAHGTFAVRAARPSRRPAASRIKSRKTRPRRMPKTRPPTRAPTASRPWLATSPR